MQNVLQDGLTLVQKASAVTTGWWQGRRVAATANVLDGRSGSVRNSGSRSLSPLMVSVDGTCSAVFGCAGLTSQRTPLFCPGFFTYAPTTARQQEILSHINLVSSLWFGVFILYLFLFFYCYLSVLYSESWYFVDDK